MILVLISSWLRLEPAAYPLTAATVGALNAKRAEGEAVAAARRSGAEATATRGAVVVADRASEADAIRSAEDTIVMCCSESVSWWWPVDDQSVSQFLVQFCNPPRRRRRRGRCTSPAPLAARLASPPTRGRPLLH